METNTTPTPWKRIGRLGSPDWTLLSGGLAVTLIILLRNQRHAASRRRLLAASATDPSLLKKYSQYDSYTTPSGFTYPRIRTFYKEHQQASQLPKGIPLLVFVHGLGGSAAQFEPLLTNLINLAPCLAIDLPGCGLSEFTPKDPHAYTTHALAELVATVVEKFRDAKNNQKVVLIGHSMGCSIIALLTSSNSSLSVMLGDHIASMISICPRATSLSEREKTALQRLRWIPAFLFDLLRWYDRRGGITSRSVIRMVGEAANEETRKRQLHYNEQSESAVFLQMVGGGADELGLPGKETWSSIKVPLFLIAGKADRLTPVSEVEQIAEWLTAGTKNGQSKADHDPTISSSTGSTHYPTKLATSGTDGVQNDSATTIQDQHTSTKHSLALKVTVFPEPSGHGLMYATETVRILSGMMENFLGNHVDERLGISWQLQHLTTSGKWDVKNLQKWQKIQNCSKPIGGLFRAMKTMREVDDHHCPKEFVKKYSYTAREDGVVIVIDISHEAPVYHPRGLTDAGVEYHKFPTVSKEKPKPEEVERFIALVDQIRSEHSSIPPATIGVHCHYGFNRTGFFVVCYLVERMGYRLQDAIEEFGAKRAPGIKHDHFVNELFVRYAVKMERRGTVVNWR